MSRQRWDPETKKWYDIDKAPSANREGQKAPFVIPDEMDALTHPVTGLPMTSKRKFSQVTRAAGCEELGNEKQKLNKPNQRQDFKRQRREEVRESLEFASSIQGLSKAEQRERIEAFKARN